MSEKFIIEKFIGKKEFFFIKIFIFGIEYGIEFLVISFFLRKEGIGMYI